MKKTAKLTADRARELLDYDPETGVLRWKKSTGAGKKNTESGCVFKGSGDKSYIVVRIDNVLYRAHRVIWLIVHGRWCADQIDHIDGNGLNNRICNLREVTAKVNGMNQRKSSNNTSGTMGVYWSKRRGKWTAAIMVDGVSCHLGYFVKIEDAITARKEAEAFYGFHENHGSERPL